LKLNSEKTKDGFFYNEEKETTKLLQETRDSCEFEERRNG